MEDLLVFHLLSKDIGWGWGEGGGLHLFCENIKENSKILKEGAWYDSFCNVETW